MPPQAVKTVRNQIYWQYSKIIADSAGVGSGNFAFVMNRFKKLQGGEIEWAGSIREYVKERELPKACIYCGRKRNLSYDHLFPKNRGGPDIPDNVVLACKSCNSSKGDKCFYEWWFKGSSNRDLPRKELPPRVAEGKYLKLLYKLHEENGTLDAGRADMERLCQGCELKYLCDGTLLTVYCLESILRKKSQGG